MSDSKAIAATAEHSPGACPRCGAPRATPDSNLWVGYQCGSGLSVPSGRWSHRLPCVRRVLERRVETLEGAIRKHRDQRGDDRCWLDDEELYRVLPEGYTPPARDSAVELERCREFIACRHNPATEYVSPQRRIEELEAELREAMDSSHRFATEAHLLAELCREAIARLDELHAASARDLRERLERILSEDAP